MPRNFLEEAEIADRFQKLQRRLALAFDYAGAMAALRGADMPLLRRLEASYSSRRHEYGLRDLREFLAEEHVKIKRGRKMTSTHRVNGRAVQRWGLETMRLWLPGYTDFDDELGGQFRVDYLGLHGNRETVDRYRVSTPDRLDPRVFRLTLAVLEETE